MSKSAFKAGFVSLVGKPNVGKSTLMNQLVGEKLSIITRKAQTTRHRILGILNGDDFQVVFSDTPGMVKPQYQLHNSMMKFVKSALDDADLILFMVEPGQKIREDDIIPKFRKDDQTVFLVINKTDKAGDEQVKETTDQWTKQIEPDKAFSISALKGENIEPLFKAVLDTLPEHPAYYPDLDLTDKPERFIVSEIIRGKILMNYNQEIPYSCEVVITDFLEDDNIIRIRAEIYVERNSQKGILIGKGGAALKKVGIESRKDMEDFFEKQIHLETFVKVERDWRKKKNKLKNFGY